MSGWISGLFGSSPPKEIPMSTLAGPQQLEPVTTVLEVVLNLLLHGPGVRLHFPDPALLAFGNKEIVRPCLQSYPITDELLSGCKQAAGRRWESASSDSYWYLTCLFYQTVSMFPPLENKQKVEQRFRVYQVSMVVMLKLRELYIQVNKPYVGHMLFNGPIRILRDALNDRLQAPQLYDVSLKMDLIFQSSCRYWTTKVQEGDKYFSQICNYLLTASSVFFEQIEKESDQLNYPQSVKWVNDELPKLWSVKLPASDSVEDQVKATISELGTIRKLIETQAEQIFQKTVKRVEKEKLKGSLAHFIPD